MVDLSSSSLIFSVSDVANCDLSQNSGNIIYIYIFSYSAVPF